MVVYADSGAALWASGTYLPPPQGSRFLFTDRALTPGGRLASKNGLVDLRLQTDGNLVLYSSDNRALWASNTYGQQSYLATVQPDGNFVLYDRSDRALWASGTYGSGETYAAVQNDGNLVVYSSDDRPLWSSRTRLPAPNRCAAMFGNEMLYPGERLWSCNRRYFLEMQTDGNLVLYTSAQRALWATGTHGTTGYMATLQPDGNLVVYNRGDTAVAATNTYGYNGAHLVMQDDGNLVIYTKQARAVWASNTRQ